MSVAFFISGHGFGHASRQVEVINALLEARPDVRVIVRSAARADLLARTIRGPYELRPGPCDTGIVQTNSVTHDDAATVREALAFHETLPARVATEVREVSGERVSLVVGDIPPLAFEVAGELGVPSIAIANFTWDWIYETHPGFDRAPWLLALMRRAYTKATLALELPFSGGFDVFPNVRALPLIARLATRTREASRDHFQLPHDRPVALLSFGGYGLPSLDVGAVDCLDSWTVVTTDRIAPRSAALPRAVVPLEERRFLDSGFRYEDLVAAVDVVITKPGYGIIAECIANGPAMLYTSRGEFREYDVLVKNLPAYVRSRFISNDDLFAGRWKAALDALLAQPAAPKRMEVNGAEIAAACIIDNAT
jgi:hypothetical protein